MTLQSIPEGLGQPGDVYDDGTPESHHPNQSNLDQRIPLFPLFQERITHMHFTTSQTTLQRSLAIVSHAVVKGMPSLPVLAFIRMEVIGGRLKLSATNLEISITAWVEIEQQCSVGVIAVPANASSV